MASRYNTRRYSFPRLLPDHFKWDGKPKRAYSREAVLMARRRHPDQQPHGREALPVTGPSHPRARGSLPTPPVVCHHVRHRLSRTSPPQGPASNRSAQGGQVASLGS